MKCIHKFLRVLKLIVIHIVSGVISEIIVSFDSVLKAVIKTDTAEIYDLTYHLFILIIYYYQLKRSVDLPEKRVCDSSLKMHDLKYQMYLYEGQELQSVGDFYLLQNLIQVYVLVIQLEAQPLNLDVVTVKKDLLTYLTGDIFAVTVGIVSHNSLNSFKLFFYICQAVFYSFSDVFCSVSKKMFLDTFISKDI